jgi:predicted aspartyl protease
VVVPLRVVGHFPILIAKIDGMDVPLVLDTGDASTVALRQSVLDQVKAVPTGESFKGSDVKGNVQSPKFRLSRLQLGRAVHRCRRSLGSSFPDESAAGSRS